MRVAYNSKLSAEDRKSAETAITALLFEQSDIDEDECVEISEQILALILARFRPDLCLVSGD